MFCTKMCTTERAKRLAYNIAHMINSIPEMEIFLNRGANAFECDLQFYPKGVPKNMYHGSPAEDGRPGDKQTLPEEYLEHLRQLSNKSSPLYRKEFCLIYFDLKLNSVQNLNNSGRETARLLVDHYWTKETDPGYVILSIPKTSQSDFIVGFNAYITENGLKEQHGWKYGWDFSGNESLIKIKRTYTNLGIKDNIWQGDGTWNYRPRGYIRLWQCNIYRDYQKNFIKKTYRWTIDHEPNIKKALRLGTDGIMTNKPEVVLAILNSPDFSDDFRLAVPTDNPFERIPGKCPLLKLCK